MHNVRLCLALAASRAVSTESLLRCECAKKVAAVLSYAHENAVEPFLEPALGIARAALARAAEARDRDLRGGGAGSGFAEALRGVTPLLRCARVLLECAVLGSTEVAGPNAPLLAADNLYLLHTETHHPSTKHPPNTTTHVPAQLPRRKARIPRTMPRSRSMPPHSTPARARLLDRARRRTRQQASAASAAATLEIDRGHTS